MTCSLILVVGCSSDGPTGVVGGEGVIVQSGAGVARATNQREQSVYYFVHEREDLARILWEPCTAGLEACPHVHPGETLPIPYSQIGGIDPGDQEAVLYWWNLVPQQGGGLAVDRIRTIVFPL